MSVSDKIQNVERYRKSDIFRQEAKNDEILTAREQIAEQKHMQMSGDGGKVRVLQAEDRKDAEFRVNRFAGVKYISPLRLFISFC